MNWLHNLAERLKDNTARITSLLFGLSGLLSLFALTDLVFRHMLGLPKDTAAYLSALSVVVLMAIGMRRWSTRAHSTEVNPEEEEI